MRPLRRRYPLLPAGETLLLLLVSLLFCRPRLTGALAYEFSFLLGIAAFAVHCAGTALRLSAIARSRPVEAGDIRRAVSGAQLSLLGPLAAVLINSLRVPVCRYDIGLAWFLLLPAVGTFFASASAVWGTLPARPPGRALLRSFAPALLFSLLTARDLIVDPPLSFLHPAFGFYSGPLYDEWIPITRAIVLHRIWTLFLSLWLLWRALPRPQPFPPLSIRPVRLLADAAVIASLLLRHPISSFHTHGDVQAALPARVEGKFVGFYYDPARLDRDAADRWARTLDARVSLLARQLRLRESELRPVKVYLFPSASRKFELTGVRATAIGNPMQRALHLPAHAEPRSTLVAHELAHVLAGAYGIPGLGLPYRVGLLEGLATAMEGFKGELSVHEWAAAMLHMDLLPDVAAVMSPAGFFREPPARAYLAAGSFCRWAIDQHGLGPLLGVYRGAGFSAAYGTDLPLLVHRWKRFLHRLPLSQAAIAYAEPSLRAKAVFDRRCPHDVADLTERAALCRARGRVNQEMELLDRARRFSGGAPGETLNLAQALSRARKWDRLAELLPRLETASRASPYLAGWVALLSGDLAAADGDLPGALRRYTAVESGGLPLFLRYALRAREEAARANRLEELRKLLSAGAGLPRGGEALAERAEKLARWGWREEEADARARLAELRGDPKTAVASYRRLAQAASTEGRRLYAGDRIALIEELGKPGR